jgi:hypothetical protein
VEVKRVVRAEGFGAWGVDASTVGIVSFWKFVLCGCCSRDWWF